MRLLKCFLKNLNFFFAFKKFEKNTLKSRILVVSEIFYNTAQQPKRQNSFSKMWPIEQLYIELGFVSSTVIMEVLLSHLFRSPDRFWTVV